MVDASPKPAQNGSVKTFACPSCGGAVKISAVGISISAVCQSCGSLIDIANENYRLIDEAKKHVRSIFLPISTRGTLFDTEWEVIGYQHKFIPIEGEQDYYWEEYLLFNPYQGFRFLTRDHGHWNFFCMLRQDVSDPKHVKHDSNEYRIYTNGTASVEYVLGEFYWRVKAGDITKISDYIAPPYVLSREQFKDEVTWSRGIYLQPAQIQQAFNLAAIKPTEGVGENQPSPIHEKIRPALIVSIVFLIALIILQAVPFHKNGSIAVYSQAYHMTALDAGKTIASDEFEIPEHHGNLQVEISSPIENNWLGLDISLVNQTTDTAYNVPLEVEHYSGISTSGSWAEGSQHNQSVVSAVPGGKYRLLVEATSGANTSLSTSNIPSYASTIAPQATDFTITLKRHVPLWGGFWIALLLIGLYPVILLLRDRHFESSRWENSDFADTSPPKTKALLQTIFWIAVVVFFIWIESL